MRRYARVLLALLIAACGADAGRTKPGPRELLIVVDLTGSMDTATRKLVVPLVLDYVRSSDPGAAFSVYLLTSTMAGEKPLLVGRTPDAYSAKAKQEAVRAFRSWKDSLTRAVNSILVLQRDTAISQSCYVKSAHFAQSYFLARQAAPTRELVWIGDLVEECSDLAFKPFNIPANKAVAPDLSLGVLNGIEVTGIVIPRSATSRTIAADPLAVERYWRALLPRLGVDSVRLGTPQQLRLHQ